MDARTFTFSEDEAEVIVGFHVEEPVPDDDEEDVYDDCFDDEDGHTVCYCEFCNDYH